MGSSLYWCLMEGASRSRVERIWNARGGCNPHCTIEIFVPVSCIPLPSNLRWRRIASRQFEPLPVDSSQFEDQHQGRDHENCQCDYRFYVSMIRSSAIMGGRAISSYRGQALARSSLFGELSTAAGSSSSLPPFPAPVVCLFRVSVRLPSSMDLLLFP